VSPLGLDARKTIAWSLVLGIERLIAATAALTGRAVKGGVMAEAAEPCNRRLAPGAKPGR